ncbi:MAG: PPC domain-containing protein [Anaerolineae bacterium]|nr:PPC domain-containing protein [Anaerolineae bacterium]
MIHTRKVIRSLAIFLVLTFFVSSIAFAQEAINVGDTVEGTAAAANVEYSLSLDADQSVVISLESLDFDTYIDVLDSAGTSVASDDDGGDGLNSRLEFTAPAAGTYTIVVRSFIGEPDGAYTLSVAGEGGGSGALGGLLGGSSSSSDSSAAQGSGDLSVGDSITDTASGTQPEYTIALSEGESVRIDVESDDFDTYLELRDSSGAIIEEDDDGGDGFTSRLFSTAVSSATYTIRIRSFGGGGVDGTFTLTVAASDVVSQAEGGSLSFNEPITVEPTGALSLVFNFEGSEGDIVNIGVDATGDSDIQATIALSGPDGEEVANSDFSGSFFNPKLRRVELPASGTYTITITGSNDEPLADPFTLSLETTELLMATDGAVTVTLDANLGFDVVSLDVEAGQSYVVTVTASEALDSTLYGDMREPGQSFADTRISVTGVSQLAFVYEAGTTGRTSFELEYFTFGDNVAEITVEAAPMN